MITSPALQLSPEWYSARAGLPTASNFNRIVTSKGEPSTQQKKYLFQLAGERITGEKEETYQNAHMLRGTELEEEARLLYSITTGLSVETVGLCYPSDKKLIGASPDGLVGYEGGIEVKCPSLAVHAEYLLNNKLPTSYTQQVQGLMFVTDRKWFDFVSYFPGMKILIVRVERDAAFIARLGAELALFCKELDEIVNKIK